MMPFPKQEKHDFTVTKISTMRPRQTGNYAIFNHLHCIYIGQADDIRRDLLEHVNRESQLANRILENNPQYWAAMVVHKTQLNTWERILVKEFQPLVSSQEVAKLGSRHWVFPCLCHSEGAFAATEESHTPW